ncbi:acyl-CoA N-acyltransferase [Fomitiporia mediterranea MF3/22]|uniref:acyl-CoA N-acyltransferase n=1 Tax=Fomitiporia mediterranea (strain MF3/22) TaxID=694068 RepID=UPI0004407C7C|nr:acyl-CoA N-acyltransferase [Fomitiporia mediterranea MF3/22]EJD07915.1 acyl-CoA N-acyltransferase [Fomitiporia mediterranea MF3/22]
MTSNRLPQDLTFDLITADEVPVAHAIETTAFPPDEAATLEQFRMRQELAPSLFLGAFLPPPPESSRRRLIGYICATQSNSSILTEESMKKHDPNGPSVCVHAVVVEATYQQRGVALSLLKEFVARMRSAGLYKRVLLICHEDMRPLYERAGFEYLGPSSVVHGALPWHEMRTELPGEGPSSTPDEPLPESSGSIPPGLLEALQQQQSSSRSRPSARLLPSFSDGINGVSSSAAPGDPKTNKYDLLCPRPRCGCVILKPGVGRLVDKELVELEPVDKSPSSLLASLPPVGSATACWLVEPSPMAFENTGFSRTVDRDSANQGARPKLKLLICADCDLGPLGWCLEGGKEFWLVCTRVGYRA